MSLEPVFIVIARSETTKQPMLESSVAYRRTQLDSITNGDLSLQGHGLVYNNKHLIPA